MEESAGGRSLSFDGSLLNDIAVLAEARCL
jgi:hypothetical protein